MRLTLEKIRMLNDDDLYMHWSTGGFPFELVAGCSRCITMHSNPAFDCQHNGLTREATKLGAPHAFEISATWLRQHLEELYALRLFYDSLYPPAEQPAAPEQAITEAVAVQK